MELLLAVSISVVIIGALYTVFHHTQRALLSSVTQVDVLESGRQAMDIITRDLSQISASDIAGATNLLCFQSPAYKPVRQVLVGGAVRTNILHELYFLSRFNRDWTQIGYRVLFASNGVGTLARLSYATNFYNRRPDSNMLAQVARIVIDQQPTNYLTLAEGVIHFHVQAYDDMGLLMSWDTTNRFTNKWMYPRLLLGTNVFLWKDREPTETRFAFLSNALPAYLELEVGILEPRARDQFQAFAAGSVMAERFISNRAGQVHLFRQRIPLRESSPFYTKLP
ncbi:MAG: hypothetical protein QHJ82_03790 [Verrucomicrobiota bacterium]|nr:hypothetical protein [Verrucomicrobiota bacterium]